MKRKWFLITLPNGEELIYKCSSWTGMTHIVQYIAGEYADDCYMRPMRFLEIILFLFGGTHVS
jgi:hypothetical protein